MQFVAVFGSSSIRPGSAGYDEGVAWGRIIAEAGFGVVTGGYFGAMEAASRGAKEGGGTVIGVTSPELFPHRSGGNDWIDIELPAASLISRIGRLMDISVATVSLPGSIGTVAELMIAWNIAYIDDRRGKQPWTVGVHASWMPLLTAEGIMRPEQVALLTSIGSHDDLRGLLTGLQPAG